jgi:hypothetical protein
VTSLYIHKPSMEIAVCSVTGPNSTMNVNVIFNKFISNVEKMEENSRQTKM